MSLRDEILKLKPQTKMVETAAGQVLVRGFSLALKDRIQIAAINGEPWRGLALMYCALDPGTEEPLFTTDDIGALNGLSTDLEAVIDAATELSAMTPADMEELEGN